MSEDAPVYSAIKKSSTLTAPARAAEPTIGDVLEELERSVSLQGEAIGMLVDIIGPVLRDDPGAVKGEIGQDEAWTSHINGRLRRLAEQVRSQTEFTHTTRGRVDL